MIKKIAIVLFFAALVLLFCTGPQRAVAIKAIVFDFGGVLATADRTEVYRFLNQTFGLSGDDLQKVLTELHKEIAAGGDEERFWYEYAQSKEKTLPKGWFEQFEVVKMQAIKPIPQMMTIVKMLKQAGYRLALLSNVTSSQARILRKLGYYDLFDPVVLSCDIGVEKPDERAFEILLDELELTAFEVLFIDDTPENIEAAKKLKFDTVLFQGPDLLIRELYKRGIRLQ